MSDLISRQAAIDALMTILDNPYHAEFLYTDEICKALNELPSAQPERKKGKWIDRGDYCVCNQCGHTEQQFNGVERIPLHTPFCAICGAEMSEEKTDE